MLIIPAIDIREGKCVRLIQGDYSRQRSYDAHPADTARAFADAGAKLIHVVDLDGAKLGEPQNWSTLEQLCAASSVPVEFGGGVRSLATAERLFALGVSRIVVGTKLVQDPELAAEFFQLGDRAVAGIDARNGMAATDGWLEGSGVPARNLAVRVEGLEARRIILTDISRDGMLSGPNMDLLSQVLDAVSIPVIHSGGVASIDDLEALATRCRPEGVIVGRALYEGQLDLKKACEIYQ